MAESRTTRRRKFEKDARKAGWAARNLPCVLCSQPIDYSLPWDHPRALTEEHIQSWALAPHLRDDPSNLGPAHADCNKAKGNRPAAPALGMTGQEW